MKLEMDAFAQKTLDETLPFGSLPHERLDWLIDYYNSLELKRLEAWKMLVEVKDNFDELNLPIDTTPIINSTATYEREILKILINDYIPRKCLIKERNNISPLRYHWLRAVSDPIKKLQASGVNLHFQKAFCIIRCYVPRNIAQDVDNIAYKIILDGLRYTKIINDDTWKQMSFMVDGDIDRENPKTEIYVMEYSKIMSFLGSVFLTNTCTKTSLKG